MMNKRTAVLVCLFALILLCFVVVFLVHLSEFVISL